MCPPMFPMPLLNTESQTQNYGNYSTPRKQRTNKPMSVRTLTRMFREAVRDREQGSAHEEERGWLCPLSKLVRR